MHAVADGHETASSDATPVGAGVARTDQVVPFHSAVWLPTAMHSVIELHDTPLKLLKSNAGRVDARAVDQQGRTAARRG